MNQDNSKDQMTHEEARMVKKDYLSKIFPSLAISLFLFLIIFIYSSYSRQFGFTFLILTILNISIGCICFLLLTQSHRKDLKLKKIDLNLEIVEDKVYKTDYEPGSATVPINILSFFLFKTLKKEMNKVDIYYIIIDGEKVYLTRPDFEKAEIGKPIVVRRTLNTKLFLGLDDATI